MKHKIYEINDVRMAVLLASVVHDGRETDKQWVDKFVKSWRPTSTRQKLLLKQTSYGRQHMINEP